MRNRCAAALAVAIGSAFLGQAAAADGGCKNPDALGVSRIQVVDTAAGPIFGDIQYKHAESFLAEKEVVLTFDDGPFPVTTAEILAALAEQCTKATFFYVGQMALRYPDLLAEVDRSGNQIGVHTWSHANLRKLSPGRAQVEIEKGLSIIETRLGHPIAPFFRFPYLSDPMVDRTYLGTRDFAVFSADVDSWDSHGLTPSARIVKYVMSRLQEQGKGIVLMHDIKHTTAAALPEILKELKAGGYKIVEMVPKSPAVSLPAFNTWAKKMIDKQDSGIAMASKDEPAVPDGGSLPDSNDKATKPIRTAALEVTPARTSRLETVGKSGMTAKADQLGARPSKTMPAVVAELKRGSITDMAPYNPSTIPADPAKSAQGGQEASEATSQPVVVAQLSPPKLNRIVLKPVSGQTDAKGAQPVMPASVSATVSVDNAIGGTAKTARRADLATGQAIKRTARVLRALKTAPAWVAINDPSQHRVGNITSRN